MNKLSDMKSTDLKVMAKELTVKNWWNMKKEDLINEIEKIQKAQAKEAAKKEKESKAKKDESKPKNPKVETTSNDDLTKLGAQVINFLQINLGEYEKGFSDIWTRDIAKGLGKTVSTVKGAFPKLMKDGYIQMEEATSNAGEREEDTFIHLTDKGWALKVEAEVDEPMETGITLIDICEELHIKSKKARRILRDNKIQKPGKTWTWKEFPVEIINLLKGAK